MDGRIDAVSTTGFLDFTTRFRKYAVSSIVSVPCVMTTPATSGMRQQLVDPRRELDPHLVVHVLRADVRDLLAAQIGELLRLRHGREELLDADLAARVAGLHVARGGAGDGAAGGEHHDVRQLGDRPCVRDSHSEQSQDECGYVSPRHNNLLLCQQHIDRSLRHCVARRR